MSGTPRTSTEAPRAPVEALLSATVLLLRDGAAGLEVFMVERHRQVDFASGALVFPGGKLDPADAHPEVFAVTDGRDGLEDDEVALRLCGIRETFEEAGVLLARDAPGGTYLGPKRTTELADKYREPLHHNEMSLRDVVATETLTFAADAMIPFAHWITPRQSPKRFDTMFYLAAAPEGQLAGHDHRETVDSVWIRPEDALADAEAGRRTVVIATRLNVAMLGESKTVEEAIEAARTRPIVSVEPGMELTDDGFIFHIPAEAGYGVTEVREYRKPSWK